MEYKEEKSRGQEKGKGENKRRLEEKSGEGWRRVEEKIIIVITNMYTGLNFQLYCCFTNCSVLTIIRKTSKI